ncbi:2553_t:CDS:2 [Entrophospora sp. SA101]|nr:2553_t:CDS:2 [Entrophospora sp. SA101]
MSEIDDNSVATDDYNHGETTSTKSVNYHHGQRYTLKLSEKQTKVLKAICGTLIGCLDDSEIDSLCFNTENSTPPSTSATTKRYSINTSAMMMLKNSEKIREFAKFDLSNSDEFIERVLDRLSKCLTVEKLAHISGVLKKLGSKGFINAQIANYNKPFYGLTKKQQEQVILKWSTHSTASTRELFRTFTFFICSTFWLDPYGFNSLIGYPGPDPEANSSRFTSRQFSTFEFLKINNNDGIVINTCGESSTNTQNKPKKDQIDQGIEADGTNGKKLEEEDLNYDVVVVGSGAGGSVIAAQLAKEGYSVLVMEKGHHVPQSELTLKQSNSYEALYEMGGGMLSEDGGVIISAGSNFGGGTTIGWSAASEPQHFVREEWAKKYGLYYILEKEYSDSMKAVSGRLGVSTNNIVHNKSNNILIEGCKKLGLQVDTIPQCTASRFHSCGWCGFGCKYGEKQSAVMTWLLDAKNSEAKFLEDCYVEKILIDKKTQKAVGVEAIIIKQQRKFKVKAKRVVLACGAIHTPALMLRSGLKNKNIGKNLHVQPTAGVYGVFPDKQIDTYSGSIMTAVSNFTENVDGNHYGSKIVVGSHHPASMAANFPWNSTFKHKQFMLEYTHISPLLVITRDRDAGRIVIDSRGQPKLYYKVSQHDSKSAVAGIIASLKILVAAGAKRVGTCQAGLEEFEVSDDVNPLNDVKFQCYLDKVKKIGAPSNQILLGSMHQMGTCCMGDDPIKSVVNPTGETWEVENLFVADSSIFPTAIGRRSSIRWSMNDVPKRKLNRLSLGNPLSNNVSQRVTYEEIKAITGLEDKDLTLTLQSLACGKIRVLAKFPKGRDVNKTDEFVINEKFDVQYYRVKINSIQLKETLEEAKDTTERVFLDRQYQVDAALVRIMKMRKSLTYSEIITELLSQLKFKAMLPDIKKRIESLINREYLKRDPVDPSTIRYLA